MSVPTPSTLPSAELLRERLSQVLARARAGGASAAEASISASRGLSVNVRNGEVETLEFQQDRELGLTVYMGQRKGNASTGDWSESGIAQAVAAALAIASATGEDPANGLADPALMARNFPIWISNTPGISAPRQPSIWRVPARPRRWRSTRASPAAKAPASPAIAASPAMPTPMASPASAAARSTA